MTEGKLNASFDGTPEQRAFTATKVRFLGLKTDTDCYLEGEENESRSIGFYFPDANVG